MIEKNFIERYTNIVESAGLALYNPATFQNDYSHFTTGIRFVTGSWSNIFLSTLTTPYYYGALSRASDGFTPTNHFYYYDSDLADINESTEKLKIIFDKVEAIINYFKNDNVGRTAANISDYTDLSMVPPVIVSPAFSVTEETKNNNPINGSAVFNAEVSPVIPTSENLTYYEINTPCFVKIFNKIPYLFYVEPTFYFVGRNRTSQGELPIGRVGVIFRAYYKIVNN